MCPETWKTSASSQEDVYHYIQVAGASNKPGFLQCHLRATVVNHTLTQRRTRALP